MRVDPTNIPTKLSSDAIWIEWHKTLKSYFGKKVANNLFLQAWEKRGSNAVSSTELRDYAKKQGFIVEGGLLSGIADFASDAGDFIGDFFLMGKYVGIAMAIILVGGIGLLVFNIAKNPAGTAKTIMMMKGAKGV